MSDILQRLAQPVDPSLVDNELALLARPWIGADYSFGHRKVQDKQFRKLMKSHPYSGSVQVQIPGAKRSAMLHERDDIVAGVSFYFGPFAYETMSSALFSVLAEDCRVVLDVGCHTGIFSLVAAAANDEVFVHAFEVIPHVAERAQRNVGLSGWSKRVSVKPVGLSSAPGTMTVNFNERVRYPTGSSFETFADRKAVPGAATLEVDVTSLDCWWAELGTPNVSLMKIDVERHEIEVFKGGREFLSSCTPRIMAEVLSAADFQVLFDELVQHGYSTAYVIDEDGQVMRPVDATLHYQDGTPYRFGGYHNVLFSCDELSKDVHDRLAAVFALAVAGRRDEGSGRWMASQERRRLRVFYARRQVAGARDLLSRRTKRAMSSLRRRAESAQRRF
jgi:FkbM family methyltransferase